jgi:hypothetical protein
VSGNIVSDACAGIMVGAAAGSNSIASNSFFNTRNTVLTADRCTPPLIAVRQPNTSSADRIARPSPARP